MGGRTLDQFRSKQRAKANKTKETDSPKIPQKEESKPPHVGENAWLPS